LTPHQDRPRKARSVSKRPPKSPLIKYLNYILKYGNPVERDGLKFYLTAIYSKVAARQDRKATKSRAPA
jgi:hypothetical protein